MRHLFFRTILLYLFSLSGGYALTLVSNDFANGEKIPEAFTCHGGNHIPSLNWQDVPSGTQSFVMLMEDPDAPDSTWTHWVLYNIPSTSDGLSDSTSVGTTGVNSWLHLQYDGPCPPTGSHHYIFTLYALNASLNVQPHASREQVLIALQPYLLEKAQLIGIYP